MAWFPWPDAIKKRACRYLLQHYLGQFLEEKLKLDQLSLDLFEGKGIITNVLLDVYAINDKMKDFNIPFELSSGKIKRITASIPWSTILNDNSQIEISGVEMTFRPRYAMRGTHSGMTESIYSSLQNMTISMELAQQCFKEEKEKDSGNMFEGLELFSQMIETVLAKINVTFTDLTFKFEYISKDVTSGICLKIHCDNIRYFDESGASKLKNNAQSCSPEEYVKMVSLSTASKCFVIDTIDMFLNLFDPAATSSEISETKLACMYGEQQLKLRIQRDERIIEPKLDTECYLGVCCMFLSPSQISSLFYWTKGFFTPTFEKCDDQSVMSFTQQKCRVKSHTKEFFSWEDALLSQTPLNNVPLANKKTDHFEKVDIGEIDQFQSITNSPEVSGCEVFENSNETSGSNMPFHSQPLVPDTISFHCDLKVRVFILHLLHIDPEFKKLDQSTENQVCNFNDLTNFHFRYISEKVNSVPSDILQLPQMLSCSCDKYTHIRLVAGPVFLDLRESHNSLFVNTKVSGGVGNLIIQECLEKENDHSKLFSSDILTVGHGKTEPQHLTVTLNQIYSENSNDLSLEVNIPEVRVSFDLSIINRLSCIVNVLQELAHSQRAKYCANQDAKFQDVLSQQALFQNIIAEVNENCQNTVTITINSKNAEVLFFFPIPDLRPNGNRNPFKKNLRPDILHIYVNDLKLSTLQGTKPSCLMETVDVHFVMSQLKILYSNEIIITPLPILLVTKKKDNLDQPAIHVKRSSKYYNYDYNLAANMVNFHSMTDTKQAFDFKSRHVPKEFSDSTPSPFSKRRVIYNNEEVKRPGNHEEIQQFIEHSLQTAQIAVYFKVPSIAINLQSKSTFESLYNRLCNDLPLWQPIFSSHSNTALFRNSKNLQVDLDEQDVTDSDMFFTFESNHGSQFVSDDEDEITADDSSMHNKSFSHSKSMLSIVLDIGSGKVAINCNNSNETDPTTNCLLLEVVDSKLCTVLQYHGNEKLDYVSFHAKEICIHQKLASEMKDLNSLLENEITSSFELIVAPSTSGNKQDNMLTLALRIDMESKQALNQCLFSCLISQASIKHTFVPSGESWFEQLLHFFDVSDTPIMGYELPSVLTETHLHVQNSAICYKPKFMSPPLLAVVTIQSLSLSSNVVAFSPHSILQVVIDNMAVYICNSALDGNGVFVPVLDVNVLEIALKLCKQNQTNIDQTEPVKFQLPVVDLTISNNEVNLQTCADSLAVLGRLITYMSMDGDIAFAKKAPPTFDTTQLSSGGTNNETMLESCDISYSDAVSDLMADAMQDVQFKSNMQKKPENANKVSTFCKSDLHEETFLFNKAGDNSSVDEFCVVVDSELDCYNLDSENPVVEYLVKSNCIKSPLTNYFLPVLGKVDQLQSPERFPVPMYKYTIKELSCKWSLFGGNDFYQKQSTSSPSSKKHLKFQDYYSQCKPRQHHRERDYSQLLEIKLLKIRFRHEIYHPSENLSVRTVLIVPEFEACDRLESSQINKMLYGFHNQSSPKQSHSNMLLVKAIHTLPESNAKISECRLFVSLQPLRINIDQDTLEFLTSFFETVNKHFQDHLCSGPHDEYFFLSEHSQSNAEGNQGNAKIFFKEIVFSPSVPIRLDYNGKHVDIEQGTITGLLKGLGQLHCSRLTLRKIVYRHGILGVDRMLNFVLSEWTEDILKNQIPSILGGVGPLHSFVQFFQGVHDLIWFPVEQFKRDGRIIKGLQKGSTAFGTSTTTAALELTNRFVCLIHAAAETTFNIVSPASSAVKAKRYSLQATVSNTKRRKQPVDLREGINNALNLVHHGVTDTAVTLARVAHEEHNQKGLSGALGGVLRHIPPTLVRPVIIASEATSNVLSGMRNQILPDAQREDELKWRSNESS